MPVERPRAPANRSTTVTPSLTADTPLKPTNPTRIPVGDMSPHGGPNRGLADPDLARPVVELAGGVHEIVDDTVTPFLASVALPAVVVGPQP